MTKKQPKYKNVPHYDALKDRLPAETLAKLHRMKEAAVNTTT